MNPDFFYKTGLSLIPVELYFEYYCSKFSPVSSSSSSCSWFVVNYSVLNEFSESSCSSYYFKVISSLISFGSVLAIAFGSISLFYLLSACFAVKAFSSSSCNCNLSLLSLLNLLMSLYVSSIGQPFPLF